MKQLLTLLIPVLIFSCTSDEKVEKVEEKIKLVSQQGDLKTFDWSAYYFKKGKDKLNPAEVSYDVIGNAEHRVDDTTLWVMPLDTSRILIEVETGLEKKTYGLTASVNQLIDSSWHHVPKGEMPSPLDSKSLGAWSNFSQFRFWGQSVPEFSHYDHLTSEIVTPSIFDGKTTLLNFWYYGCKACMEEIPALNRLREEWKDDESVQLISLCLDSVLVQNDSIFVIPLKMKSTENINAVYLDFSFRQIGNSRNIAEAFAVLAYPTNIIIDRNGKVQKIQVGAQLGDNRELATNFSNAIRRIRSQEKLNFEIQPERVTILD
ncbi:TlpA disulfide reductase family protein [Cryomorphaceae bacterium 1068]|nr:TlpA disulfide reductase family protein [Cryomorphaceae bacterium 1068]